MKNKINIYTLLILTYATVVTFICGQSSVKSKSASPLFSITPLEQNQPDVLKKSAIPFVYSEKREQKQIENSLS